MNSKPKTFEMDTENHGKVLVTMASTGVGAFVSVSPFDPAPFGTRMSPLVWVADVRRDLAAMLPD